MQTAFFIVIGAIMVTVLFTFKSIQEDEDDKLLEKLKDKNLSEEDLKKLYEDLKNKKE